MFHFMLGEQQCQCYTSARAIITLVMQDRNPVCFIAAGCEEEPVGLAGADM